MNLKRLLCIVLSLILVLSCTGCKGGSDDQSTPEATKEPSTAGFGTVGGEQTTEAPEQTTPEATEEPSTEEPSTEAPEPETDGYPSYSYEDRNETVYTTDNLNIRKGPTTDAEIVTVLKKGSSIKRTGYHADWSRLEYEGQVVYAASAYLTTEEPATDAPSELDNKRLDYGYDHNGERDANNMPVAMNWYVRNWGDQADFVQDTSKKIIYLTIDEGYENGYTPSILDTLKEKNVTAVFFLTEQFVEECPHLVQRMIDEGHILGNHTCSHPANGMPSLTVAEQEADIMKLHNMVKNQFGYEMKLFRFPSGIYSDRSLATVTNLGYRSVFWSVNYRDFYVNDQWPLDKALKLCIDEIHPGAIYLLHAVSSTNAAIMGDFIDQARALGYEFGVYPVN
ncbi:MAG: polysaccharide deacetylase family protein [Lachnospiraceae bacterium]|nr:polysaccharide deacetylase family protein [Lachnospiraceae bacterium]